MTDFWPKNVDDRHRRVGYSRRSLSLLAGGAATTAHTTIITNVGLRLTSQRGLETPP